MKNLVCLISGQHIPNLLMVRAIKPDGLVLLVTSVMKKQGKDSQFLKALSAKAKILPMEHEIIDLVEENSPQAVVESLQRAVDKHPNDEWIINITGGTKPMSIGAYEFAKSRGLRTLYLAEGNQGQAIDLLGGPSVNLDHKITSKEFLAGYGFDILNERSLPRAEDRAMAWADLAASLAKHSGNSDLRGLLGRLQALKDAAILLDRRGWERDGLTLDEEDDLFLENTLLRELIAAYFGLRTEGDRFTGRMEKAAVEFLTGKWLEVFVWCLLRPFAGGAIWDLHLGISAGKSGPGENNDLDVSFMKNQSLCIVECKTGGQDHDPQADDVLYKIEAVKSGPKALRVDAYLATTSDNVKDPEKGGIREKLLHRSKMYGCKIIPGWKIQEMADLYLSSNPRLKAIIADEFSLKIEEAL